ncbi:hypothetical protein BS46_gp105 [Acinetobacter phage BS46]|nr:hypothetical protein BS46_gp105 [Acinetobacter phage BS46]
MIKKFWLEIVYRFGIIFQGKLTREEIAWNQRFPCKYCRPDFKPLPYSTMCGNIEDNCSECGRTIYISLGY